MVAGAAALMIGRDPSLTPDTVKARLMKTATKAFPSNSSWTDPVTGITYTTQYDLFAVGAGYLDIWAALNSTDILAAQTTALSPQAIYDPLTGEVSLSGSSVMWGSSVIWVLSDDRAADVHATIADALGTLGPHALEAAPALVRLLDDEHEPVRQSAASALGALGTRSPLVVPALIHALDDRDHDVRAAAADGLASAGPAAASAAASLVKIVSTDRIGWVRLRATIALGRIRALPEAATPVLVDIVTNDDWPTLRAAAVDALASYASSSRAATQAIAAAARDTSPEVRDAAARALRAVTSVRRDSSASR
jgi:hypothetical protein